ncbi:MAG: class I SAM-dependent methyltransferase [Silvanigrellaceae bacterium]|nr:class I SAM-dependent methyltransferase [Silvanigrellaceae bacterium]
MQEETKNTTDLSSKTLQATAYNTSLINSAALRTSQTLVASHSLEHRTNITVKLGNIIDKIPFKKLKSILSRITSNLFNETEKFDTTVKDILIKQSETLRSLHSLTSNYIYNSVDCIEKIKAFKAALSSLEAQVLQHQFSTQKIPPCEAKQESKTDELLEGFYLAFENRFRGSQENIKEKLAKYLPYLESIKTSGKEDLIYDVGCGRGEWLELLLEKGFSPVGLDIDSKNVSLCREKGFIVIHTNAMDYLSHQEFKNSAKAITAFHVIEHLNFKDLLLFFRRAYEALQEGGALIVETPNPDNVLVSTNNFYMDPSHVKPLPKLLVAFAIEYSGFKNQKVLDLNPYPESYHFSGEPFTEVISKHFFGPQDYAIIAYK